MAAQFIRNAWYVAAWDYEVTRKPMSRTIADRPLALYRTEEGKPVALADACWHRLLPLSMGRLEGDELVCGYHGWTYNGQGRVIRIPQYDADRAIPADYCTPAYRCVAKYGYAWVALEEPIAPIPEMPEFEAEGWRTIFQFHEVWAAAPLRALENSFDNSHFSFVHRATFGVAAQPKPSRYELVEKEGGFYAEPVIDASKRMVGILSLGDISHAAPGQIAANCLKSVAAHH